MSPALVDIYKIIQYPGKARVHCWVWARVLHFSTDLRSQISLFRFNQSWHQSRRLREERRKAGRTFQNFCWRSWEGESSQTFYSWRLADTNFVQFYYRQCDLAQEEDIRSLFSWIESHPDLGRVDICINNAGFSTSNTLLEGNFASWRKMMDVNVLGIIL